MKCFDVNTALRRYNFLKNRGLTTTRLLLFFLLAGTTNGFGQVNEHAHTPVYEYLYRMAQKGLIVWKDYQLPQDRTSIFQALTLLREQENKLSATEEKELRFYSREYLFDSVQTNAPEKFYILKKDSFNRFRTGLYEKGGSKLFVDPIIGSQYLTSNKGYNLMYFSGIKLAGYFGKHWGINFSFRDITERGDTINAARSFTTAEGPVTTIAGNRLINYSTLNFNVGYRWKNGALAAGKDNLLWGYGIGGNIFLSGRAPSFPYIKLDFQPWHWLHFNYFHGWLHSDIIDSAQSYNTGSGLFESRRDIYRQKFIAHHSITLTLAKGLDISLGESMVYSDRLNIGYLIPVNFFRGYDHYRTRYNIKAGDNSQFFGMISSRNHLKKTHLYAQLLIDEIRASKVFNKRERRNQIGYTIGANRTDLFLHYLTAGVEYSRINPFVYNNLFATQTYESHSFSLGDWMGNNADRLYLFMHYTPVPRMKLKVWHQSVRKGAAGTLQQQYFQQPQPQFLFEKLYDYKDVGGSITYELMNRFRLYLEANRSKLTYVNSGAQKSSAMKFGFSYGL